MNTQQPSTKIKTICSLYEGNLFTVWACPHDVVLVRRHADAAEWAIQSDSKEDDLLRDLLPKTRWDTKAVDLACEDAWNLVGPRV